MDDPLSLEGEGWGEGTYGCGGIPFFMFLATL
jgi:hypothetical protein